MHTPYSQVLSRESQRWLLPEGSTPTVILAARVSALDGLVPTSYFHPCCYSLVLEPAGECPRFSADLTLRKSRAGRLGVGNKV